VKTERVTLLTTPDFKAFLAREAAREGVSVAELVRSRCERRPSDDEALLAALTKELLGAVAGARSALREALAESSRTLRELKASRGARGAGLKRAA
jgi:hypothetical protein